MLLHGQNEKSLEAPASNDLCVPHMHIWGILSSDGIPYGLTNIFFSSA